MKRYVIGDIHGQDEALKEVLNKVRFDYKKDRLIVLGDVADGGVNTYEVIEELLKIKNLIYIIGNHDCLTPETEVLTKRGWIPFPYIISQDNIFSLDKDGLGRWTHINEIIRKEFNGELVSINTTRLKIDMTPTHRVLLQKRDHHPIYEELQYSPANKLSGRFRIPICAETRNEEFNISDDEIRIVAWILTDGCILRLSQKHTGSYSIYQSKPSMVEHIKTILNNLGWNYSLKKRTRNIKQVCGKILKKNPLDENRFGLLDIANIRLSLLLREKKEVPEWVEKLSERQFKIFLNELILGDGSRYRYDDNSTTIIYGQEKFLNSLQAVCVTKGWSAMLSKDTRNNYRLNICKQKTFEGDTYLTVKKKQYCGEVWCLNVPLSNFMIRKEGRVCFTGNCWFMNHIKSGWAEEIWLQQGGCDTLRSYGASAIEAVHPGENSRINTTNLKIPVTHQDFFNKGKYYHIEDNMLFVHGGFRPKVGVEKETQFNLVWDRDLIQYAQAGNFIKPYDWVFVGHTTTQTYGLTRPVRFRNLFMMDCGAGWKGKLCIMDIDTKEYKLSRRLMPSTRR